MTYRLSGDSMVSHFPLHPLQSSLALSSAVALSQEDIRVTSSPHRVPLKGFQNSWRTSYLRARMPLPCGPSGPGHTLRPRLTL